MTNSLQEVLCGYRVILASGSPRRRDFFSSLGIEFTTTSPDVDESYPSSLSYTEIPRYLSLIKARAVELHSEKDIVITADTIVCTDDEVLGKPSSREDAIRIIRKLSGRTHNVITGVTIRSIVKEMTFHCTTSVTFDTIEEKDIVYYVDKFSPMDKAGAYAIQEWIGEIGITQINGSYHNVVGMPMAQLYSALKTFVE